MEKENSRLAMASYILGIVLVCSVFLIVTSSLPQVTAISASLAVPSAAVSFIAGIFALYDIRKNNKKGKGLAIAGIVISGMFLISMGLLTYALMEQGWVS